MAPTIICKLTKKCKFLMPTRNIKKTENMNSYLLPMLKRLIVSLLLMLTKNIGKNLDKLILASQPRDSSSPFTKLMKKHG